MALLFGEERRESIWAWSGGGKGRDSRYDSALGVVSKAEIKLGSRVCGSGWRVSAE